MKQGDITIRNPPLQKAIKAFEKGVVSRKESKISR